MMKEINVKQIDSEYIWHPLTQHKTYHSPIPIVKASGCELTAEDGSVYVDGISSWYTAVYGHCNPKIINKVAAQMQQFDQIVFSGFTHPAATELAEELFGILPSNQAKMFFSDNGSTSVDVAIKMALQFHFNRNQKRNKLIALEEAFHGDTFGAMSVSGLSVYNGPFDDFVMDVQRIPVPKENNFNQVFEAFKKLISSGEVAAFIFEPLVQGAAAMKMYPPELLDQLIAYAQSEGVLCIADEVMTGFGKTGKNFASDYLRHKPDILCLSKALTGGLVPMALTTATKEVFEAFYDNETAKGFFHGHTYSANPIACAAAVASIQLLKSIKIQEAIKDINKSHLAFQEKIKTHKNIKSTRCIGVILAIDLKLEMERYGSLRDRIFNFFMSKGLYLRPLGETVYLLPPYTISKEQLKSLYDGIASLIEHLDEITK